MLAMDLLSCNHCSSRSVDLARPGLRRELSGEGLCSDQKLLLKCDRLELRTCNESKATVDSVDFQMLVVSCSSMLFLQIFQAETSPS